MNKSELIEHLKLMARYQDPARQSCILGVIESIESLLDEPVHCEQCKFWDIREGNDPNKEYFCTVDNMWCKPTRSRNDSCSKGIRRDNVHEICKMRWL